MCAERALGWVKTSISFNNGLIEITKSFFILVKSVTYILVGSIRILLEENGKIFIGSGLVVHHSITTV